MNRGGLFRFGFFDHQKQKTKERVVSSEVLPEDLDHFALEPILGRTVQKPYDMIRR